MFKKLGQISDEVMRWFEGRVSSFPTAIPERPPATFLAFILHYSKPFWPLLLGAAILAALIAITEVVVFSFVGDLVNWFADTPRAEFWTRHGSELLFMAGLAIIILPGLQMLFELLNGQGIMGNFAMRNRWQTHRYVLRQSISFYQDDFAGRIATKVMQTSLAIRDVLLKLFEVIVFVSVYFISTLMLFITNDIRLGLPIILWFIAYCIALYYFVPRLRDVSREQAEARSVVTGRMVDSYTNIATVKMFAHTSHEDDYAKDGLSDFLRNVYHQMRLSTGLVTTLNIINAAMIVATAAIGIWLWHGDFIRAGTVAFSLGLVVRLQGMAHWILWEVTGLFENIGIIQDGATTIARHYAVTDVENAQNLHVSHGEIHFQNVHFNYGKNHGDSRVLDDFTLHVKAGEKIGVVGRSGGGKSTLVSLLLRFYDLEHGQITIDDQNISQVTQDSLHRHIGLVTQDTSLLHRSVRDNIRYGKADADEAAIIAAAEQAHADDFIHGLADLKGRHGYDAHVGERGVKLSGGQRQRIAIARVLLKNAPILILDEATSALDSEVEAAIQENLNQLMQGKTVIAIAHRLSTIAAMDRLIIMDQGRIVEQGHHDELIAQNGLYASLWAHQSGGFLAQQEEQ